VICRRSIFMATLTAPTILWLASARGNVFAENLMIVAHTARKQKKNVLAFLAGCCARRDPSRAPSLFDIVSAAAA
jgi:hypothetical protein